MTMHRTAPTMTARPVCCGSEPVVDRIRLAEKMDTRATRHHLVLPGREAALTKRLAAEVQTRAKTLAILPTNLKAALDTAFPRRVSCGRIGRICFDGAPAARRAPGRRQARAPLERCRTKGWV